MHRQRHSFRPDFRLVHRGPAFRPITASFLAAMGLATAACGQGLMDIGANLLDEVDLPFTGSYTSSLGWDSDAGSRNTSFTGRGRSGGTTSEAGESAVWQNALSLAYGANLKSRDRLNFTGNYTNSFYFDPPPGTDDMDHNLRIGLNYSRQVTRSLTISDSLYVSYENEPNYDIGLSVNRPTSGYFLASNRLSANYLWSRRLSTVSAYNFSTIIYEDDSLEQEGYLNHQLSQQFRYSFKRRLIGTATYRYGLHTYEDNDEGNSTSHSLLLGVDYVWNRRLSVSASAGVDYQNYDEGEIDNQLAPRLETSLNYVLAKRTTARWVNAFGLDDTGRAGAQSGYTYRTGLSINHGFTRRLTGTSSLNYIHSKYGDSPSGFDDSTENTFYGSIGLGYSLWRNISLTANYSYSRDSSDDGAEDYVRHRVFAGLRYVF